MSIVCNPDGRALFRSGFVTVHDGHCAAGVGLCAGAAAGHRVVFTRAGAFVPAYRALRGAGRGVEPAPVGDPTRVLLANAGEPIAVRHAAPGGHACTTFTFCAEAVARPFARREVTVPPEVLLRFHALRGALVRGGASPLAVEAEAIDLLQRVLAAGGGHPRVRGRGATPRRREIVEAARDTLVRSPGRAHHLADVADALDISPSHLAHVFRAEMGMPLHQYLLHLRLAVALERLAGGDEHLSALALDLGFATHSHFSAAFRRWYGASPAAVRRSLGGRAPAPIGGARSRVLQAS